MVSCSCAGRRRHESNNQKLPWYSFAAILPNQHFSQGRRPCTAYVHYDDVGLHVQKCTLPSGAARQYVALRCRTPLHPLCISVDCALILMSAQALLRPFHVRVQGIKALMSMTCLLPCQSWACWITGRTASMPQVHKRHVCLVKY